MYSHLPKKPHVTLPRQSTSSAYTSDGRKRAGVYIPPNYSGTAMTAESPPIPHFENLPQASQLPIAYPEPPEPPERPIRLPPSEAEPSPPSISDPESSLPSSPTRSIRLGDFLNSSHFPWGHGIGKEEIFLLGILWLLMMEEKEGGEDMGDLPLTLFLLGALLFCG